MIGLCTLAAVVVAAVAAASASAALPELGRCEAVSKTGKYQYSNCVKPNLAGKGNFEWKPGPGAKPKFAAEVSSVKLETVGKTTVLCASADYTGEWTGAKAALVNLAFHSCENPATKKVCSTNPTAGAEIKTEQALEGELGFIVGGEKPTVGLDLKAKSPSTILLMFTCGGPPEPELGEPWLVEGSVIAPIKPVDVGRTEFKLFYKATAGHQTPEQFEGGVKDTLITERLLGTEKKTEQAGLTLKNEALSATAIFAVGEEKLEIKAK
jgi:hypothetical protein